MNALQEKLKPLRKLVGTWQTTGKVHATPTSREVTITGTDTYTWLPGEYFLLHTVDVHMGEEHNQTHEIIGYEEGKDFFFTHYFDNKGKSGAMIIMVSEPLWVIHGGTIRFTGGMSVDEQEFSGIWEQLDDEKQWQPFMEIRLVRDGAR
jgi:hypothetical protein